MMRTQTTRHLEALMGALIVIALQGLVGATPATSAKSAELEIYTSSSDGPVQGALVILTGDAGAVRVNVSAANGLCRFVQVEAGTYSVRIISRPFFISPETEQQLTQLVVSNGQRQTLNVRLVKGGVISGRIIDPSGNPIIGLPVTAVMSAFGKTSLPQRQESNVTMMADDRGEFRIYGIRPGQYVLAVNAQRDARQMRSVSTAYYPGERNINNARVFNVTAGDEIVAPDMTIDLDAVVQNSIRVSVVGSNRALLKGVLLTMRKVDSGEISDSLVTDETGAVVFAGLPTGKYSCKTVVKAGEYFNSEQEVNVNDRADNEIVLNLRAFPVIAGTVYLRQGREVKTFSNAGLSLVPSSRGEAIDLRVNGSGEFSVTTGLQGNFWWSFPQLGSDKYLASVHMMDVDFTDRPIRLERMAEFKSFAVEYVEGAAAVTGQVGSQWPGGCPSHAVYAVGLKGTGKEIQFVKRADVCTDKAFGIYSLRPGRYCIVALAVEKSGSERVERVRSKSAAVDDYEFELLARAIAGATSVITLASGEIHEATAPILVQRQARLPAVIRTQ
jgi:uncharacterized protein (DUF2141 family)